ncbi:MAG: hypothetical protein H0W58_11905 [Acidobacteria bacterium]|nr:hypothetical protein [Acidobacteriota bacterium]
MKILCTVFLSVLLFVVNGSSQVGREESNTAPKMATIKITLLDLPGVKDEKSKWEIGYELRIINQKELNEAMTNGRLTLDADQKIGEFIAKGSFVKNILANKENREVILTIPLNQKIQEKLADELESRIKSTTVAANKNALKPETERQAESQYFLSICKRINF